MANFFLITTFLLLLSAVAFCQKKNIPTNISDTAKIRKTYIDSTEKKDTLVKKKHDPKKATLYAAICPGLGQVYNKKYWKVPLAVAAVGVPTYFFIDNRAWYNKTRYALSVVANGNMNNPAYFKKIDSKLQSYINSFAQAGYDSTYVISGLISNRNQFRKYEDYSILYFLLFYALQIVDATVDAHLKEFNVSSDLSFQLKPAAMQGIGGMGLSLAFDIHKPKPKALFDTR